VLVLGASRPSGAEPTECTAWSGETSLQDTVDRNDCVEVQRGTYDLDRYLLIADGRTLQGDPDAPRDAVVLRARAPWNTNGNEGVITGFQPPHTAVATIRHLTVDGNGLATGAIGAANMVIDDVVARGGRCWGIAIVGPDMTVTGSAIRENGADPDCPSAPGAGIYASANGTSTGVYAPVVTGNEISHNTGPGVDVFNVWGGILDGNDIHDNTSWAGISLLGSNWSVRDNTVRHPTTGGGQPWMDSCRTGPLGARPSAIILCQGTIADGVKTAHNTVSGNRLSSYYGILSIGNDEGNALAVPTDNRFSGNVITATTLPCADDFRRHGPQANVWIGCKPRYF
jgi:parallel beta-helix repeat protein